MGQLATAWLGGLIIQIQTGGHSVSLVFFFFADIFFPVHLFNTSDRGQCVHNLNRLKELSAFTEKSSIELIYLIHFFYFVLYL